MFRLAVMFLGLVVATAIGLVGYWRAKKSGHKIPSNQFVWYFALSAIAMQIIIRVLNYYGLYPE